MARMLHNYRIFSFEPNEKTITEGCRLLRLALHRHSDLLRTTDVHRHRHHQILFYLRGDGHVRIGKNDYEISAGTGILLPTGCEHQFIRHSRRNPLCLVMDFSSIENFSICVHHPETFRLSLVRKLINELTHLKDGLTLSDRLQRNGIGIQLLGICLATLQPEQKTMARHPVNLLLRIESLIEKAGDSPLTLRNAAQRIGYQKDYLNRILKQQSGMTFGQIRGEIRLRHAEKALKGSRSVTEAAHAIGFDDVNYFVRWFRRQSGKTPGKVLREKGKRRGT